MKGLRVCENGVLAEPIDEILDLILQYNMVLCTGHIAPAESLSLVKRAREKGLKRIAPLMWNGLLRDSHETADGNDPHGRPSGA